MSQEQFDKLWEDRTTSEYLIKVFRMEPKDQGYQGLLKTYQLPVTVPDIIEAIGVMHGGGKYQIRIVGEHDKYIKSRMFEIAGKILQCPKYNPSTKEKLQGKYPGPSVMEVKGDLDPEDNTRFQLYRLEPQTRQGVKISGYLERIEASKSLTDIIEYVGCRYGGGSYQLRLVDGTGKYIKSRRFEIAGFPLVTPNSVEQEKDGSLVGIPPRPSEERLHQVGDIVMHQCGARMTIQKVNKTSVVCVWFDPYGNDHEDTFKLKEFEKKTSSSCKCSSSQLLHGGCQCGGN